MIGMSYIWCIITQCNIHWEKFVVESNGKNILFLSRIIYGEEKEKKGREGEEFK
jgi:hypothetical protein